MYVLYKKGESKLVKPSINTLEDQWTCHLLDRGRASVLDVICRYIQSVLVAKWRLLSCVPFVDVLDKTLGLEFLANEGSSISLPSKVNTIRS